MYFGAISADLAERIFNETGVDAENYNITISSNEIRKILLNSHGDEKKENLRGQRAITEDDILAIPKIIEEADFIELDRKKYDGKPIIRFIKTINERTDLHFRRLLFVYCLSSFLFDAQYTLLTNISHRYSVYRCFLLHLRSQHDY